MASNLVVHNASPRLAELIRSKSAQVERLKEQSREQIDDAVNTVEIVGTAFAVAAYCGRYPEHKEIEGIPLGAVVSVAAYLGSFFSGKTYAGHLKAIGKGALAAAAVELGREMGEDRRAKQNQVSGNVAGVGRWPRAA